jgi:hypothetical protein
MQIRRVNLVVIAAFFASALLTVALQDWILLLALLWGIYFIGGLVAAFRSHPTFRAVNFAVAGGLSVGLCFLLWARLHHA